ncbi:MAG: inositol monophosphatase [Chloroflexi bacterium]|nr:inositol monophosphatase [Chloroflexota bacterium]
MSQRFQIAVKAARAAGKVLADKLQHGREIKFKGRRDIVTDADYAADRIIRETLLARFPNDQFLSEEGDAVERQQLWAMADESDHLALWVVDPLDGTTNYSRNLYPFTTSIAMYQAGKVQVGVVYDPISKELYAAERGRGAWLNGKLIRVSGKTNFEDSVVGTEWARSPQVRRRTAKIFSRLTEVAMTARVFGSAAISLSYIAAGRLDGYFHLSLSPWDVAAAALIIEEAGGKVTNPHGQPWSVHSKEFVASNGKLHGKLLKYFKS